jgi:penicillin V acylase-like amidase (Ntn superfamily)
VRNAFTLLDDVAQGDHTQWSIVYDIRDRRAYLRTQTAPRIRWIDLDDVRFATVRCRWSTSTRPSAAI